MDHLLTRADQRILRDVSRTPDGHSEEGRGGRYVPEYIDALIRELAKTYSQNQIARILNQRLILRPNGLLWQQFHLCRYFKQHGIVGVGKWKGPKNFNIAHERKDV